ncbi:MAG TPA: SMI1/KNR4 family protein, partial [Gemmatimonadales bacterium]|nr:SMI1/KNR4 family protein [Gemmatimonadales bacterium]
MLTDAITEVLRAHHPNPPATAAEIAEFERKHGILLDSDLRAFYAACNGASLFRIKDSPYEIVKLDEITSGEVAIFGTDRRFG